MNRVPSVFLLCGALLAPALAGAQGSTEAKKPARTVFQRLQPCKVAGVEKEVLCGALPVWENRGARSGRKIGLNIVVVPAQSDSPAPDPVVYINGGPGYGSTGAAGGFVQLLAGINKDRDLVFVDQRGTGKSNPLHCDLPGGENDLQGLVRGLFPMDVLRACEPKLEAKADLTQYTTSIAMDDLDEVRAWLGSTPARPRSRSTSYSTIVPPMPPAAPPSPTCAPISRRRSGGLTRDRSSRRSRTRSPANR
ncbi:MAG TPA: hypothetical protein VGS07_09245 [Thermoanaerobaculia bacterium]|jgi:hypothetical protein|nr:hypothetical protein [Thermoanaerobaculia bacterium]